MYVPAYIGTNIAQASQKACMQHAHISSPAHGKQAAGRLISYPRGSDRLTNRSFEILIRSSGPVCSLAAITAEK